MNDLHTHTILEKIVLLLKRVVRRFKEKRTTTLEIIIWSSLLGLTRNFGKEKEGKTLNFKERKERGWNFQRPRCLEFWNWYHKQLKPKLKEQDWKRFWLFIHDGLCMHVKLQSQWNPFMFFRGSDNVAVSGEQIITLVQELTVGFSWYSGKKIICPLLPALQ